MFDFINALFPYFKLGVPFILLLAFGLVVLVMIYQAISTFLRWVKLPKRELLAGFIDFITVAITVILGAIIIMIALFIGGAVLGSIVHNVWGLELENKNTPQQQATNVVETATHSVTNTP